MSRAFVNEDAGGWSAGSRRFVLPPREDPAYEDAAARALLQAHIDGDTGPAEAATGFYWGDDALRAVVSRLLDRARVEQDEDIVKAAERFLR